MARATFPGPLRTRDTGGLLASSFFARGAQATQESFVRVALNGYNSGHGHPLNQYLWRPGGFSLPAARSLPEAHLFVTPLEGHHVFLECSSTESDKLFCALSTCAIPDGFQSRGAVYAPGRLVSSDPCDRSSYNGLRTRKRGQQTPA